MLIWLNDQKIGYDLDVLDAEFPRIIQSHETYILMEANMKEMPYDMYFRNLATIRVLNCVK